MMAKTQRSKATKKPRTAAASSGKKGTTLRQQLLELLAQGHTDLNTLCEQMDMPAAKIGALLQDAQAMRQVHGLRLLMDCQTQMIVSRYRVAAAARLVALSNQQEDPELARKASVDLLKMNLMPGEPNAAADDTPKVKMPSTRAVVGALEKLGKPEA